MENLLLAIFVLVVILTVKHWTNGMASNSAILIGIIAGYIAAFVMSLVLPTTGITADGAEYTKAWVLNWDKVAQASWISIPEFLPVKPVFDARAIAPILIMFIVTAVETVGDISGVIEGGMNREATDKELSGGVICDGIGSSFAALVWNSSKHLLQPERRAGYDDKSSEPYRSRDRRSIPDPLRSCSEAGRHRFYYAAGCSRRRSRYDVLIHRDQRNPAGHKGEMMTAKNLTIVSVALGVGYGMGANTAILAQTPQAIQLIFGGSGIVPAAMVAILLNIVLPNDKK